NNGGDEHRSQATHEAARVAESPTHRARTPSTTHLLEENHMTKGVSYTTKNLTEWTENRRAEIELDAVGRVYLGDAEITDRDRIAFALRELRKRGYDAEACPVD